MGIGCGILNIPYDGEEYIMINGKEFIPRVKRHIARPRIEALYKKGLSSPLTTVVAGPGFGKTTSCATFINTVNAYVIWVDLSELHNDVDYFWEQIKRVGKDIFDSDTVSLNDLPFPATRKDFQQLFRLALNKNYQSNKLIIVYDNYEILSNPEIIHFVGHSISLSLNAEEFSLHHILLCNERLDKNKNPFFEDYNTPSEYNRITDEDLAFTKDEIEKFYSLFNLSQTDYPLEHIVDISGGWPVFISILCETKNLNKTYLVLFELFENHFYGNYRSDVQMALIKMSLFPEFQLGLMFDILKEYDETIIQEISTNIFIQYDFSNGLFIFQQTYLSFLQDKQVLINTEDIHNYYNIAGDWFSKTKSYDKASQYYMQAKNYECFLDSLSYTNLCKNTFKDTVDMQHFFIETPTIIKEDNPWVDYYLAYTYLNCNQVNLAKKRFEELLSIEETKFLPNKRLMAETHRTLGEISLLQNSLDGLNHIEQAAALVKNDEFSFHQELNTVDGNPIFFLPEDESKNVDEMIAYINDFCAKREQVSNSSNYGYEHLFAAEAYYYGGHMKKSKVFAKLASSKAMLAMQYDIAMQAQYLLTLIAIYEKDYESMAHELEQINLCVSNSNSNKSLVQLKDIFEAATYLEIDDEDRIADWIKQSGFEAFDDQPLKKGRNYFLGALCALHVGDFSKSNMMLFQLDSLFEQRGLWILNFYSYLVKSIYYYRENQKDICMQFFVKAYNMVYDNNLYVLMIELGIQILPVLTLARSTKKYNLDMDWLKDIENRTRGYEDCRRYIRTAYNQDRKKLASSTYTLTKRENNVLNLLSQGYTRNEIADHLEISVNGVKKFINNIYTKLGAKNRAEAIFIATQNNLL